MIHFFGNKNSKVIAVQSEGTLNQRDKLKLTWLFARSELLKPNSDQPLRSIDTFFIGPRAAMISPWSTNAVEISENMGIRGIVRIEEFNCVSKDFSDFDPMIFEKYKGLNQEIFTLNIEFEPTIEITDIANFNKQESLALNDKEVDYLNTLATKINRKLTDSEVFGFSQVNSEHCRHKIFNGTFVIDGKEKPTSLFKMIKETSKQHPNDIVSAYKDNVAFIKGPKIEQFAPKRADSASLYQIKQFDAVISLKAETHNFPSTVEPFNGAATGSGGEIRDRLAGGKGSIPLAGTSVYMTSYSRLEKNRPWESLEERQWLYQKPVDILIKASNGASDFGNKFGQPLIAGSVFTFEHEEKGRKLGFDKVIMQAGGIGYGKNDQAFKKTPSKGDKIVILGGDNYRIGMGGAAVSSSDTGATSSGIELNAIQRSNPEMQKRVANTIRGMVESDENFVISIHDHGAGGHLNCLSELVEDTGGTINLNKLPIGDPTLSNKEIIGNESQERMGLVIAEKNLGVLKRIAERERSPLYEVGEITGDKRFTFESSTKEKKPIDLALKDLLGSFPKIVMKDISVERNYETIAYNLQHLETYLVQVLQLEAVACKDWLTNKVDRCVGGKVAKQQCIGKLQIPLNNVGVMALDFNGKEGVAVSIGHSPISGLIDPVAGSRNSIVEALTNIVWAPIKDGLRSISLSANWMWPCKNEGEDARLYEAVKAASEFCIEAGINIPTGKDSLSMKQRYPDEEVIAPGTVIISAVANCNDITKVVEPTFKKKSGAIYYINISKDVYRLGGGAFAQILNKVGNETPNVKDVEYVKTVFNTIQDLIKDEKIVAGHDVSSGGLITTLLELCFADIETGADIDLTGLNEPDSIKLLFSENSGIVLQSKDNSIEHLCESKGIELVKIGKVTQSDRVNLKNHSSHYSFSIYKLRDVWYKTSYLLDKKQTAKGLANVRYKNYKNQPLKYVFPKYFTGKRPALDLSKPRPKAAIIREKGSNSEREMANAMYIAGFDVKDVHMTDLISGRENLEEIHFIGVVGGFSNSDVLGSAKGWAGAFRYNEKANRALKNFFRRKDTLSIGICNGCQLWMELNLIDTHKERRAKIVCNDSEKHESAFTSVKIQESHSIMLSSLAGATLGVWISHGEGKFRLPHREGSYHIVAKYAYDAYPHNPNGSDFNTAMMTDKTGRHLVTMPHIERSIFQWNWAYYPEKRNDEVSPWIEAFTNARIWIDAKTRP